MVKRKYWIIIPLLASILSICYMLIYSTSSVIIPKYAQIPSQHRKKILKFDAEFAELINLTIGNDFKMDDAFWNKLHDHAIDREDNYTINILLIGASHGGSDPFQKYLKRKYPTTMSVGDISEAFFTVMMEPAHQAFKDLDRWTKENIALYNSSSLHLLNAAFNDKYKVDDELTFYDWSDEFVKKYPKEPLYILYQQGSFVREHLVKTFHGQKRNDLFKDEYIGQYTVPSFCLQTITKEYFLKNDKNHINIVFVDAQGFEYYIVKSLLLDDEFKSNLINFELDMNQTQHEELVQLAQEKGYNCWCPWHEGCCQDCKCSYS